MSFQSTPDRRVHSYDSRTPVVDIPPNVLAASPVVDGTERHALPLNLVARIISYVDDVGDLARLTRTARILYYMALPKLWEHVTLRSYADVRYVDGRPEGFGGGSPFTMGLAGIVSGSNANYVKRLTLAGEYRELDADDYSKGRVPNNAMMLNIAVRAAIDRLPRLETFEWLLNIKMAHLAYQGLANRPSLTSLTLKFPSGRTPRPTSLIPPMPHLRKLTCIDIDPMSYPDDISLLLAGSRKLESLTMHWNPRIRRNAEQCISLGAYFHRCMQAGYSLKLKHFGIYNLYAPQTDMDQVLNGDYLESIHTLSAMGGSDADTVFLDETWKRSKPKNVPFRLKIMRSDVLERDHIQLFSKIHSLEEMYLLSSSRKLSRASSESASTPTGNGTRASSSLAAEDSPMTVTTTPGTAPATPQSQKLDRGECISFASDYLAVIQHNHTKMRNLLLPNDWNLDPHVVKKLVIALPNLEQLGLALKDPFPGEVRVFFPYARKLKAFRILNKLNQDLVDKMLAVDSTIHEFMIGHELWQPEFDNLKYFEAGSQMAFRCGKVVPHPGFKGRLIRIMKRVPYDEVKDIEIWAMDTRDVL